MADDVGENYLSLFEAAKLCSYSEAYLRLRARQGKLKSIKIGKKWMTTKEWVNDYVLRAQEWNEKAAAKRIQKEAVVPGLDNPECLAPNLIAQPAGSFALPQIEFSSARAPELSIPEPPRSINYANPQFLFVLGSSVMVALLLFVWMAADLKIGPGAGMEGSQASLSKVSQQPVADAPTAGDNFERQMDPQTLEKALDQRQKSQMTAAVDQLQIVRPEFSAGLLETMQSRISDMFGGGR